MRIKGVLKWCEHEIRMQVKNGMYPVYIIVNLIYIFALGYVPDGWKETVAILLILSDPTFLGMIFVGGILLLEKNNSIPKGIGVSPIGSGGYILGKCFSLLLITAITANCILVAGKIPIRLWKELAILLTALLFTMIGMILSTFSKSLNHFIALFIGATVIGVLPIVLGCYFPDQLLLKWIPTFALFRVLIQDGFQLTSNIKVLTMGENLFFCLELVIWCVGTYVGTKHVIEKRLFV
ncbi:hypothetical protein [Anaerosporobacter faecicola]|uniref:hypothetical protein n=1 Tax=Anaerosporobacter faecicola TaxID=2718714 RepID=UPI00143ADFBB|nr:hypothetical protein [Anaerosporobacter faecicola]